MDWNHLLLQDLGVPVGAEHECPYLPERQAAERAFLAEALPPDFYHSLMDHGWRRSGMVVYKPACPGCQACTPIRIPVADFRPNRTQRRLLARNADITAEATPCTPTQEKLDLFVRYQTARHSGTMCTNWHEFSSFLYSSPIATAEYTFRIEGNLAAIAIVDVGRSYFSAVYTYFDPDFEHRSLGTWAILWFIQRARALGLTHYYLGYFIDECRKMNYKTAFRPFELGNGRGEWTRYDA
ncbi:MAG: leucyl-tRNA---protein transferase [Candidatus Sumerlaeota bacterium]|nr:leucyl-tRNA---protein transferase [Candidatus Sumerlaeota bacterium]